VAQITSIEREIAKLEGERETLRDLLVRVRRENSTLRDVTRKNSVDRILIENRVMNLLRAASKPIPTNRRWWAAQEINPRLTNTTFRSHLHQLKSKQRTDPIRNARLLVGNSIRKARREIIR
jgi:hypothetical protein